MRSVGDSLIKGTGVLVGNFEKNPQVRYQDPALWVWLEIFSPQRTINSRTTHYIQSYFFPRLNTLKGTVKAPAVDLLRLNTLRDSKTAFFNP